MECFPNVRGGGPVPTLRTILFPEILPMKTTLFCVVSARFFSWEKKKTYSPLQSHCHKSVSVVEGVRSPGSAHGSPAVGTL